MGWSVEKIESDKSQPNLGSVIDRTRSRLNALKVEGASSAKVAMTECMGGSPYAVITFNESINLSNMNPKQLSTTWKVWKSTQQSIDDVISDFQTLIGDGALTDLQLFYSNLSLTVLCIPNIPTNKYLYTLVLMYRA